MEKVSGIKFDEKRKPVYYFTERPFGAMGFQYDGLQVSLLQGGIDLDKIAIDNIGSTFFHESSHPLFAAFTRSEEFLAVAEKMKQDPQSPGS